MMIVAVSRIPLPKTERYLYWVRVASESTCIRRCFSFIFAIRRAMPMRSVQIPCVTACSTAVDTASNAAARAATILTASENAAALEERHALRRA